VLRGASVGAIRVDIAATPPDLFATPRALRCRNMPRCRHRYAVITDATLMLDFRRFAMSWRRQDGV